MAANNSIIILLNVKLIILENNYLRVRNTGDWGSRILILFLVFPVAKLVEVHEKIRERGHAPSL